MIVQCPVCGADCEVAVCQYEKKKAVLPVLILPSCEHIEFRCTDVLVSYVKPAQESSR